MYASSGAGSPDVNPTTVRERMRCEAAALWRGVAHRRVVRDRVEGLHGGGGAAHLDEEGEEVLHKLGAAALAGGLHGVHEQAVLGGHVDRLLPLEVLLVHLRRDPPERYQLMLLHTSHSVSKDALPCCSVTLKMQPN